MLGKIAKNDYKYVPINADPGFSAERNRQVIEEVIKESEAYARKKRREHDQQVKERTAAVAEYLKSVDAGGKETDIRKYFGEEYLLHLKGQNIMEKIRSIKIAKGEKVFTRDA